MTSGHIWRRTATERNGRLIPLPDDWSLWDAASGLSIARIHTEPDGGWRRVCRAVDSNEIKDSIMGWFKTGKQVIVDPSPKGSRLDADYLKSGVLIPCRLTDYTSKVGRLHTF